MAQQTRYILNKKDGRLLIWNAEIATNPDYVEITPEEASDIMSGINFKDVLRRKFHDEREEELNSISEPKVAEEEEVAEPEEKPETFSKPYVARAMPPAPPPTKYSVKEIKEAVGDDPEKAALAIEDEKSQLKPRPSLIRDLKLIIAKAKAAEEETEEETEEESFDDGAVADVDVPSDDPAIKDMLKDA